MTSTTTPVPVTLEAMRAVLARTPEVLRALVTDLPEPWLRGDDGPDTWSPHEVIAHLVHAERTNWLPRVRVFLDDGAAFPAFDRLGQRASLVEQPTAALVRELAELRAGSLAALDAAALGDADLARTSRHPELGPVTLAQLLATWTVHDLAHTAQITRTMARQYADAVGPWRAFFRTLDPKPQGAGS